MVDSIGVEMGVLFEVVALGILLGVIGDWLVVGVGVQAGIFTGRGVCEATAAWGWRGAIGGVSNALDKADATQNEVPPGPSNLLLVFFVRFRETMGSLPFPFPTLGIGLGEFSGLSKIRKGISGVRFGGAGVGVPPNATFRLVMVLTNSDAAMVPMEARVLATWAGSIPKLSSNPLITTSNPKFGLLGSMVLGRARVEGGRGYRDSKGERRGQG